MTAVYSHLPASSSMMSLPCCVTLPPQASLSPSEEHSNSLPFSWPSTVLAIYLFIYFETHV